MSNNQNSAELFPGWDSVLLYCKHVDGSRQDEGVRKGAMKKPSAGMIAEG
jgi:hypothetical protein